MSKIMSKIMSKRCLPFLLIDSSAPSPGRKLTTNAIPAGAREITVDANGTIIRQR
jgi:hypothetical protein